MRFSVATTVALAGLSAASPLGDLNRRADVVSVLSDLYANVQVYTGAINATLATLTPSSSLLEKTAAVPKVGESLNSITKAITDATGSINDLAASKSTTEAEKRGVEAASHPVEKRQVDTATVLLTLIIVEIFATIAGAIAILGLAALLIYINPLTGAIAALILAVQLLLNVVLASVTLLLNTLLAGLALTIGGL
ncbi:hypothetical protein DPSP01_006621 [Paraphaeosphaeria sporulosa]|uniref:Hydrophobic surface binding protein A n=1 Tax=Paraphaeosphaeria sporulosa TaxID=1460663 RepID=A0A177CK55_9PLEO|nr:uncharacterized protein CC84DRAFT_1175079 [Paraphaeosphaeria sporulosa]OAG07229.1 hypothetical protein CC84DRAFT_1175079 [Paraphaeosphaeria sporulosa]